MRFSVPTEYPLSSLVTSSSPRDWNGDAMATWLISSIRSLARVASPIMTRRATDDSS